MQFSHETFDFLIYEPEANLIHELIIADRCKS